MGDVTLCYDRFTSKNITIPMEDRFLNMLVLGPTGTGKSSLVFTPLIFQDLRNNDCGLTIIDPKEDLAEAIHSISKEFSNRKVIYVDPTEDNCPKFNPLSGDVDMVIKNMMRIFTSDFNVDSISDKQTLEICRILILKTVKLLKKYSSLVGDNINIKNYYEFIVNKNNYSMEKISVLLDQMTRDKNLSEYKEICEWLRYDYFENRNGLYDKCLHLRMKIDEFISNRYILKVLTPEKDETNILNFNEHLLNGDVVIINTKNTILGYLGKSFGELIMLEYLNSVFQRKKYQKDKNKEYIIPNFLYVDEFSSFSPVLTDLFIQGRSFRVGTHIAVQNRHLLKICGGENSQDKSFIIESNARNLVLFPGLNGEDAKYYSEQFCNLKPSEIMYRPFGQIVYRVINNKSVIPPSIGLVFFINQRPSFNSINDEFTIEENGDVKYILSETEEEY